MHLRCSYAGGPFRKERGSTRFSPERFRSVSPDAHSVLDRSTTQTALRSAGRKASVYPPRRSPPGNHGGGLPASAPRKALCPSHCRHHQPQGCQGADNVEVPLAPSAPREARPGAAWVCGRPRAPLAFACVTTESAAPPGPARLQPRVLGAASPPTDAAWVPAACDPRPFPATRASQIRHRAASARNSCS